MDLRPVLYVIGIFLCALSGFMAIPMFLDLYFFNTEWKSFAASLGICAFFGVIFVLGNRQDNITISGRQAFLLTVLSWVFLCLFSAVPFMLIAPEIGFAKAIFESMSGLTTTGATVLVGLDAMPAGIIMWRAILHFIGGVGIIVMAISVLPMLKVGGMQLFRLESSEREKIVPRITQLAAYITYIYIFLTVLCAIAYVAVGMSTFDAIVHAMGTISTGGFSSHDKSFAEFPTNGPEVVAIIFMISGALPFVLYIKLLSGDLGALMRDQQVVGFFKCVFAFCAAIVVYLAFITQSLSLDISIQGVFSTVSLMTGTGFTDADYMQWGSFGYGFLMFVCFVGGCAGSASCGIKIFRLQILYEVAKSQIYQMIYPNGVFVITYNNQPLTVQIAASVMAYFFIFMVSYVLISLMLMMCGLDFMTSMSGSIATLSAVGPGLGNIIGPTGNYSTIPDNAIWVFTGSMFLGRLEFFALLVLFVPRFWKY